MKVCEAAFAKKRSKRARVWLRTSLPICKFAGISSILKTILQCNFPDKQQYFHVTNRKLVYCFRRVSISSDKFNALQFFPQPSLHIVQIYDHIST